VAPPPTTVATARPTAAAPPAAPAPSSYPATVAPIDTATAQRMTGVSWRPGCPVALADLRLLHLPYRGFDGGVHTGELVVAARWADGVVGAFHRLFDTGYPIERMQLVDDYGASDDASVLANNTSAFNCRAVTGGSGWSRHAYGSAVDIDPRQNPYVYPDGHVLDPAAAVYTNRGRTDPGMIHAGDTVFRAFAGLGWRWGGYFSDGSDPQHFDSGG
jgi:poly-gamma-glutamate synthesis protein (capsule biosynthesis protein)